MSDIPHSLPSSPVRNSSANYVSAAREIEQEKQMVAALKRLSIGNLMTLDPDLPPSEATYSFVLDRDLQDESTASADSLSLSKTSPATAESNASPPRQFSSSDLSIHAAVSPTRRESKPSSRQASPATSSSSLDDALYCEDLLWVPANMHPEINPQQFKNHVKSTIDELLERKLSRSKSSNRSKRSSLSLSTTDETSPTDDDQKISPNRLDASPQENRNHYSNPSLRKLTNELQRMSKLAGMDSNDAVTLARSLSTSSLGYSDVERMAFDEMENASNASTEMLDLGPESMNARAYQTTGRSPQSPPNHSSTGSPRRRSFVRNPSPYSSPNYGPKYSVPSPDHGKSQNDEFGLRRSRRLDYRKGPHTSQLGSQLQNNKAEKLATLRQNLSTADISSYDRDTSLSRQSNNRRSMQSINPRNSQVLFSYKNPSKGPSPRSGPTTSSSIPLTGLSAKDSPYMTASSNLERNIPAKKYVPQNTSSKKPLNQPAIVPSRAMGHQHHDTAIRASSRHAVREHEKELRPDARRDNFQVQSGKQRSSKVSSSHLNFRQSSVPQSSSYPSQINSQQAVSYMQQQSNQMNKGRYISASDGNGPYIKNRTPHASGLTNNNRSVSDGYWSDRIKSQAKRDKSRELNQNLDLLRNEINEFKESLALTETKKTSTARIPSVISQSPDQEQNDFSFDLTTHEVSYEDTLGIEEEILTAQDTSISQDHKTHDSRNVLSENLGPRLEEVISPKPTKEADESHQISHPSQRKEIPPLNPKTPIQTLEHHISPSVDDVNSFEETQQELSNVPAKLQEVENKLRKEGSLPKEKEEKEEEELVKLSVGAKKLESDGSTPKVEKDVESEMKAHTEAASIPKQDKPVSVMSLEKKAYPEHLSRIEENAPRASSQHTLVKKKSRKNWPWSKEKLPNASSSVEKKSTTPNPTPVRSVSSPEISSSKREASSSRDENVSKDNVITKLFKKRRSNSVSHEKFNSEAISIKSSNESIESETEHKQKGRTSLKESRQSGERNRVKNDSSRSDAKAEKHTEDNKENKSAEDGKVTRIKNKFRNITKGAEEKTSKKDATTTPEPEAEKEIPTEEDSKPKSTLEVQEKLKKSIKRHSKANQPLEFTDSAFGFPLPPPSQSTLVMIDYRFPVHVERAIYRLSHLKLANPKRSLREQVILSNFMYAYLNLVDHTLHLEQQMDSDDYDMDLPTDKLDMLGDQDIDTEFESDGEEFEDSDFDSMKLGLDTNGSQISV